MRFALRFPFTPHTLKPELPVGQVEEGVEGEEEERVQGDAAKRSTTHA